MGDTKMLNLEFELSFRNIIFGAIKTRRIGVGAGPGSGSGKLRGWLPFGPWEWRIFGKLPPVPEYWLEPRFGGWSWQLFSPTQSHILLTHDGKVIGSIANFNRPDFEKGKGYMDGDWVIDHEEWRSGGRWVLIWENYS